MLRISRVFAALIMAGIAAVAAAETVYKWVDGAGQVHYTDLPPRQGDAEILGVYQQESGSVDDEGAGDDYSEEGDDSGSTPDASTEARAHPSRRFPTRRWRPRKRCGKGQGRAVQEAQERYQRYIESRRLFRETADGKREYLTDKELTDARARAKQAVDDYCS